VAKLDDPEVQKLLTEPNYAVVSTVNPDGSIVSAVVWVGVEEGMVTINSAKGRRWPSNLRRDARVTVLVYESGNPLNYVEIRGSATTTTDGVDDQMKDLRTKYEWQEDSVTLLADRVKVVIRPNFVRHRGP
jgi:PPOX class probable F420-dependent enzyme